MIKELFDKVKVGFFKTIFPAQFNDKVKGGTVEANSNVNIWASWFEAEAIPGVNPGDEYNPKGDRNIGGGTITNLQTGEKYKTGNDGYAKIHAIPGSKLTLLFNKKGYSKVQSGTVVVPEEGLVGDENEMTLQVPSKLLGDVLVGAVGKPRHGCSHIVTTIQALGKSLHEDDGEPKARAFLIDNASGKKREADIYLGMNSKGQTDFLPEFTAEWIENIAPKLAEMLDSDYTSEDGGVIWKNVPVGNYSIIAEKTDIEFTKSSVDVFKNSPAIINVSPPQSPRVIGTAAKNTISV